ncbi:MAG: ribonuclease E/G [Marinosulfonomonas sp.]|nr:ribonuclease E/G [Marinosulfonomonas sp.]
MKGRVVALGQIGARRTAALIVDGRLDDVLIDGPENTPVSGAIFRAICDRPLKGQGGMIVRLPDGSGYLRGGKGLRPGQAILVQVTGYAEAGKAVPVTAKIVLKGRSVIVTPDGGGINVSRAVKDEEDRLRIRAAIDTEKAATSGFGVIARTAAVAAPDDEISIETDDLVDLTRDLLKDQDGGKPELLLDGPDAHMLAWREWGVPDLLADSETAFEDYDVSSLLDEISAARVALPGGGHFFVEPTRALVAIDVNTGGDTSLAAGLKANIAVARELPRQLRCRGLGGQITIDFAPMPKKDRRQLEHVLKAAFRTDSTDTALAGWTPLGNFELQRKRERLPLTDCLPI